MININNIPAELLDTILTDKKVRIATTRSSHEWFFDVYLSHYLRYPPAPLQEEMIHMTEDETVRNAVIVSFRESAKSTILTLSYPLWAVMGKQQKKLVIIVAADIQKAKTYLGNIKAELERNELLRNDLGPFEEEEGWTSSSLILKNYDARIMAVSVGQGIRGLRHREHRPDLVIIDDVEDLKMIQLSDNRDNLYNWFLGEVMSAMQKDNSKVIVVGNLLHQDALPKRLEKAILEGRFSGIYKEYPLIDKGGRIAWPGKYPDMAEIDKERRVRGLDEITWQREYMLKIIPNEGQLVHEEWLHYYDQLPAFIGQNDHRFTSMAVDLAIAQTASADYTAIVSGEVYGYREDLKIYILPNPVNEKLTFPETVGRIVQMAQIFSQPPHIIVESVGYQLALVQRLESIGINAEGFIPHGTDKRARLSLITHLIQSGRILFPRYGAEKLIEQVLGFGIEKHDDLVDALVMLVLKVVEKDNTSGHLIFPRVDNQPVPKTMTELEKEAERLAILQSEAERSGDPIMMRKYHAEKQRLETKEYWQKEALQNFNEKMRGYRGW